jgi:hypothetical protein
MLTETCGIIDPTRSRRLLATRGLINGRVNSPILPLNHATRFHETQVAMKGVSF